MALIKTGHIFQQIANDPYAEALFAVVGLAGTVTTLVLNWKRQDDKANLKRVDSMYDRQEAFGKEMLQAFKDSTETVQKLIARIEREDALSDITRRLNLLEAGKTEERRGQHKDPSSRG